MTFPRKILASLAVVAAGTGLMVFGTVGAFDDTHAAFSSSVLSAAE